MKWLVGIDEAGRGPLAGPVAVAVFAILDRSSTSIQKVLRVAEVKDSKKLSEGKREEVYGRLCELRDAGEVLFACSLVSARVIDKVGITKAVKIALARSLQKLALCPRDCDVRLDGLLRAPSVYKKQRTIIRGDDTVSAISAASIVAKVTRDRYMRKLAKKYPDYVFQKHKGYGTKSHYDLILANGLCALHRRSYLSKIRTLA